MENGNTKHISNHTQNSSGNASRNNPTKLETKKITTNTKTSSPSISISPETEAIINLGKIPISSKHPEGTDIRFEPDYEEVQMEIDKLSSLTQTGATDWNKVITLSITLLKKKTKNILVASYLCIGLLYIKGMSGMVAGVCMYRMLIENFWDCLFPLKKRQKARQNAIEWWLEKNIQFLKTLPDDFTLNPETQSVLVKNVEAIIAFLTKQTYQIPLLYQLQARLSAIPILKPPHTDARVALTTESDSTSPTLLEKAPLKSTEVESEAPGHEPTLNSTDARKSLKQGLNHTKNAAAAIIRNDPSDPKAYRLNRMTAWLEVEVLPTSENGQTLIPPPINDYYDALKDIDVQDNAQYLLETAEDFIGQYLFWLDLNRYSSEALNHLGCQNARQAVEEETVRYIKRLPGIEKMTFADGTPFADEHTLAWLEKINPDKSSDTQSESSSEPSPETPRPQKAVKTPSEPVRESSPEPSSETPRPQKAVETPSEPVRESSPEPLPEVPRPQKAVETSSEPVRESSPEPLPEAPLPQKAVETPSEPVRESSLEILPEAPPPQKAVKTPSEPVRESSLEILPEAFLQSKFDPSLDTAFKSEMLEPEPILKRAQALAKDKKLVEALALLQITFKEIHLQESRFLWCIRSCQLLVAASEYQKALPHILEIIYYIEKYELEKWQPDLALKGLVAAYKGLKPQNDEALQLKTENIRDRICQLSPAAGLRLENKGSMYLVAVLFIRNVLSVLLKIKQTLKLGLKFVIILSNLLYNFFSKKSV